MLHSEYIIVAFLDNYKVGDQLIDWPLHITIIPWFAIYNSTDKFKRESKKILNGTGSIRVTVGDMFFWGKRKVNILDYSISLHRVHERLLGLARTSGRLLVRDKFLGRDFTPHVSQQGERSAGAGQWLNIDCLYIIEKHMNKRQKRIVAKINL